MWRITSTTLSLGWLIGQTYAASNSTSPSNTTSSNLCVDDTGKGFLLVSTGSPTIVYTDPSSPGAVHHAAASFAQDLGKVVSGSNVQVKNASSLAEVGSANDGTVVVFFGGLDSSSLINQAINATGVNFSGTRDQWEAWSIQTGSLGNGAQDVVIMAGADRRGTAYAAYTVSEEMGVSPWYWWADVPITSHDAVHIKPCSHVSPAVKYRGIFLNDEQPGLTQWANKHFNAGPDALLGQSFLPDMYGNLFELVLRMKGNMIWPAMWADMFAVAGLGDLPNDGKSGNGAAGPNQVLADEMGIIYSTSHQEPMARNTPEWSNYGTGEWNYTVNKDELDQFWRYGAERSKDFETIYTVSMRGNGDLPLPGANIKNLQAIVEDQRTILSETHGNTSADQIPQIWALYKEVQGYYDTEGMQVADDITFLWTDDNWGNIRRVPLANETDRAGGAGLYYHFDYVGDPRNYKWISTINLVKTWEQLNVALTKGLDRLWIFNVGDLKPIEVATTFGLALGYEGTSSLAPSQDGSGLGVTGWVQQWASRTFPQLASEKVAKIIVGYNALNAKIKPELLNSTTWSLIQYDEAERVEEDWQTLIDLVNEIAPKQDDPSYPAWYQLVAYPTLASANLNMLYMAVGRANQYASQARTSANLWADKAEAHFQKDNELTGAYHALLNYKWDGLMSQTHINYQYWQQPMRDTLPGTSRVQQDYWPRWSNGPMRITIPGLRGAWPGDNVNNCALGYNCPGPTLSGLSRYSVTPAWVDVGSGAWEDFEWTATPNTTWVKLSSNGGKLCADGTKDTRVEVMVDWDKIPANVTGSMQYASVMFASQQDGKPRSIVNVTVIADPQMVDQSQAKSGSFVGGASYISMHASNATRRTSTDETYWADLPTYGLTGNAVTDLPPTHSAYAAGQGPSLEFDFYSYGMKGPVNVTAFFGPFENYHRGQPFQYALQFDGSTPSVAQPIPLAASAGSEPPDWNGVVGSSIRKSKTTFNETSFAEEGWHTLTVWNMVPGMVLEQIVIGEYPLTTLPPPQSYRMA